MRECALILGVHFISHLRFLAMIPHQSNAILTSERANTSDPSLRKLANDIMGVQMLLQSPQL